MKAGLVRHRRILVAGAVVLVGLAGFVAVPRSKPPPFTVGAAFEVNATDTYVLAGADRGEVSGVVRLLRALGRQPSIVGDVDPARTGDALVWVPASANPAPEVLDRLERALRSGARMVIAGPYGLASRIGIAFGGDVRLQDERYPVAPDVEVRWGASVEAPDARNDRGDNVVATTADGKHLTALSGAVDHGRFLWLAAGTGRGGSERFPLVPVLLRDLLQVEPAAARAGGVSLYVDPGAMGRADPGALADEWLAMGVRRIYLAGWEFGFDDGNADYDAYVRAAHSRGVEAFLWLAPPMVNERLWRLRPECRQQTASGDDAIGDWRKLIALEDPACFDQAVTEYRAVLAAHDWDGINVAELYYEGPGGGPDRPDLFTPMSEWVRRDFEAEHGFDPADLFDPASRRFRRRDPEGLETFLRYRADLLVDLHRRLLTTLRGDLPVVVTTIDDRLAPDVARNIGIDVDRLLALGRELGVEIEIEDPFPQWTEPATRYERLRDVYGDDVAFDLNVLPREHASPTATPMGSELVTWVAAASRPDGAVTLFSAATLFPLDGPWVAAAVAAPHVRITDTGPATRTVEAPFAVWLRPGTADGDAVTIDGEPWPLLGPRGVLVPGGRHEVVFGAPVERRPGAELDLACSCEVIGSRDDASAIAVVVRAEGTAWISAYGRRDVGLDGAPASPDFADGRTFLRLPAGEHTITFG